MNRSQVGHAGAFLAQFHNCYDGLMRGVRFRYTAAEVHSRAVVVLSVRQSTTLEVNDGWVNVRLAIEHVEEYALKESAKVSCRVLSGGLQINAFRDLLFFDFDPYSDEPTGVEDFRRSGFYIAGRSFSWRVGEYSEQHARNKPA